MYLIEIHKDHAQYLGQIRHWNNLKIASDGEHYWVKELTEEQLNSLEVKSIPFKQLFRLSENRLIPYGKQLPVRKLSGMLIWTPIEKGLPVKLTGHNHNYFGIQQQVNMEIVTSQEVRESRAMLVPCNVLATYVENAPNIRLLHLRWVILFNRQALILGTPLLPIPAKAYWVQENFLLPEGYDFNLNIAAGILRQRLDTGEARFILWHADSTYTVIPADCFRPLTRASVRLTLNEHTQEAGI